MSVTNRISQDNPRAFRNPWVLGWLLLLVVVLSVNAGMILTAINTNPGLVEEDYYEKGRDHEENFLKTKAARSALGWEVGIEAPRRIRVDSASVIRFTAVDKHGTPVTGGEVVLTAYRPSDASADFSIPMKEVVPGQYDGFVTFPLKGIWDLKAHIERGHDEFDVTRRVSVRAD